MYYYLVDPKQYDGKNFEFFQTQLLSLVGEYHISGETARVTKLRTTEDLVVTALSHGATTLVVVGGDETFTKVASVARGKQITLGFVPVNSFSELAGIFGLRSLHEAVTTIAKRRIENLDVARIGQEYFISSLHLGAEPQQHEEEKDKEKKEDGRKRGWRDFFSSPFVEIEMVFDGSFRARDQLLGASIINSRFKDLCPQISKNLLIGDPKDGWLDVVMAGKLSRFKAWRCRKMIASRCFESLPGGSVIHARKVDIVAPAGLPIYLYDEIVARVPATVQIVPEKIRVIVGKERQF